MRRHVLILFLLLACLSARGSTVHFNLTNFNTTTATNWIVVIPTNGPVVNSPYLITGLPIRIPTTNGIGQTNLLTGSYWMQIYGIPTSRPLIFTVPNDAMTYEITDLLTNGYAMSTTNPPFTVSAGRKVYVDQVNGNNASAARGNITRPSSTISNAIVLAQAGDVVEVLPGTYQENKLLKKGVSLYGHPGANIVYVEPSTNSAGYGIWDDRATGATTNTITWDGTVYYCGGTNGLYSSDSVGYIGNLNVAGAIVTTNANTVLNIHGRNLYCSVYQTGTTLAPANWCMMNCASNTLIHFDNIEDWMGTIHIPGVDLGINGDTMMTPIQSGVFWAAGFATLEVPGTLATCVAGGAYSIWGDSQDTNAVSELYFHGGNVIGKIYTDTASLNFRFWATFDFYTNAFGVQGGLAFYGSGKNYVKAQKIACSGNPCLQLSGGTVPGITNGECWVEVDKFTASAANWVGSQSSWGGKAYIHVKNYEIVGTSMTSGFDLQTGTFVIEGGEAEGIGNGIKFSGGRATFKNVTICTTNSNAAANIPVVASAAGLSLRGCVLVAPAVVTNSIYASSAKTVGMYWSAGNRTNSSNITLSPNAGFTVDANAR